MKVFKNLAVVFAIFLFFFAVLSCEKGEETLKVDLDKKTSDVSQLVKTALLRFDPAGKHKDGLINWDKTDSRAISG